MVKPNYDEQLIALSKRGIIAFPGEDTESLLRRAPEEKPLLEKHSLSNLQKLYSISPDWVNLIYSNAGLHFWEGGCTWEEGEKVKIQLREKFTRKKKLYGIYAREELLEHELVHAVRAPLQSRQFEELFAYQTSASRFRRFLGPIVQRPKETLFYLLTWVFVFLFIFWPLLSVFFLFLNLLLVAYGLLRLLRIWFYFIRAKKKLSQLILNKENLLPFMLFLTDQEICFFAKTTSSEIMDYLKKGALNEVRLQQLSLRFL